MGILNVTPDSFSDGGNFLSAGEAVKHAESLINQGADILDIGGESTRPGSQPVSSGDEIKRVVPVIRAINKNFDIPISVDTTKFTVAQAAIDAGAHIINDISGLRFDERLAAVAAECQTGLILMHSRGDFATLHAQEPAADIILEVITQLQQAITLAIGKDVKEEQVVLDIGIGFGKTQAQNLELIAKLDKLKSEFKSFPILVGASRKSFIGKLQGDVPPSERLFGSLSAAAISVWNGGDIIRVHDVKETVEGLKIVTAIKDQI
jgi:dihydropteroate synthase